MNNKLLQPDSAKKNFTFQTAYQFIILVVPLIVSPYLTRILGGTSLGVYSYTYSIAYYFVVFAMLGINKHGQRIISQRRSDIAQLRKTFWSLFSLHFAVSCVSILAYVFYVIVICRSDKEVAFAQTLCVASAAFDLTWLFYGLEKFKTVTIRNAVVRIINTICIFALVKSPSDVIIYTIIMAATVCAGQIILFPQVFSAIPLIRFTNADIKEHVKPLLTLFAAVVAATLYTVFDKTLLGLMASKESVAYYEYSDKIINIPKTFIAIISTVLYPKACQYAGQKDYDGMQRNMETSLTVTSLIGFAAAFGLLSVADQFALLYYGEEFAICGSIISMMCPLILIICIGETVRSQYIYPLKMDMTMVKVLSLNAVVNLVLSASFIPILGINGAVVGTIAAELTGLIIEIYLVRKYVTAGWMMRICAPFAIVGAVMYVAVRMVASLTGAGWISLLIQILSGGVVYCLGTLLYMYFFKRELLNSTVKEFKGKLKKKMVAKR